MTTKKMFGVALATLMFLAHTLGQEVTSISEGRFNTLLTEGNPMWYNHLANHGGVSESVGYGPVLPNSAIGFFPWSAAPVWQLNLNDDGHNLAFGLVATNANGDVIARADSLPVTKAARGYLVEITSVTGVTLSNFDINGVDLLSSVTAKVDNGVSWYEITPGSSGSTIQSMVYDLQGFGTPQGSQGDTIRIIGLGSVPDGGTSLFLLSVALVVLMALSSRLERRAW